ncbi:MAG: hypothetical protein RJA37_1764 [Verrucomicrobiota bacterium]
MFFDLGPRPLMELQQIGVGHGIPTSFLAPIKEAFVWVVALEAGDTHVHQAFRPFEVKTAVFGIVVVAAEGWLVAFPDRPDGFALAVTQGEGGIVQSHAQAALEFPTLGSNLFDEGFVFDVGPDSAGDVEFASGREHPLRRDPFLVQPEKPHAHVAELGHFGCEAGGLGDLAECGVARDGLRCRFS